ncbi:hypothetical protein [Marinitenerispora sediminis]|uniref:hypothetical protein n=1 Tax=Marinitenerispora sediminis TaxID=1931232 RepID=UPI001F48412A|nr:hypothetical protein [Marinitenerispora sediminis]
MAVGLSAGGHALSSGHAVAASGLVIAFAGVFLAARAAAGRERGFAQILGWMLWGQLALHLFFSVFSGLTGGMPPDPAGAAQAVGHQMSAVPSDTGASGPGMLAAHLGAAVVSAWWLRRGEAAAFSLAGQLVTLLFGLLWAPLRPRTVPAVRRPAGFPRTAQGRPRPAALRHVVVLRGPPRPLPA